MSSLSTAATPARAAGPPVRFSNLGDELLARYAARGSDRAFAAIYERYHQRLYRYCRSIVRDDTDAQDALQSTFAGALAALRRSQRNAPLRPWLYKIAHNEAISLLRRRTRNAADELPVESLGVGFSVEQEVAERARWRSLVDDLSRLPDRQRGALLLRELSGLSHEEIGIALGTTTAGAKQAIFEARQALGEIEEGREMSCEDVRRRISEGDRRVLRGRRVTAHLRDCAACETFALSIPARRAQLTALTPALPPTAAAVLLTRSLRGASAHGGAGGSSVAATAGITGKAISAALTWKAVAAGAAILATTAAGITGLAPVVNMSSASSRSPSIAAPAQSAHIARGSQGASSVQRSAALRSASTQGSHAGLAADHGRAVGHGANATSSSSTVSHGKASLHTNATNGHSSSARGQSYSRRGQAHRNSGGGGSYTTHASGQRIGLHVQHSTGKPLGVHLPVAVPSTKVHAPAVTVNAAHASARTA